MSSPALMVGETCTVTCGESSVEITLTDIITDTDSGGMGMWSSQGMRTWMEGVDFYEVNNDE